MKQKLLAILLATTTLVSMAGCANGGENSSETEKEVASSVVSQESTKDEGKTEPENLLPWTGEEITFTFFYFEDGGAYPEESLPIVEAFQEKLGNIKLDLEILPLTDFETKIPLLLAGGDIPDIMIVNDIYTHLSTYGESGTLLDWAPYMEEYMPNLYAYSQKLQLVKSMQDGAGHQYGLPIGFSSEDRVYQNWVVNVGLLNELGLKVPETQEEFLEVCRKVKAEKDIVPIQKRNGMSQLIRCLSTMFKNGGDRQLGYYAEEGKWDYGPTREDSELKNFVSFMNLLWEEGLIDHEINTQTGEQVIDYLYNGEFAFTHEYNTRFTVTTDSRLENLDLQVMPTPKGSAARTIVDTAQDGTAWWGILSDAETEHPELLASVIDLMFSEEVAILDNYGLEGETYEMTADGPVIKEGVTSVELTALGHIGHPLLRAMGITDVNASRLLGESPHIYESANKVHAMLDSGELEPEYIYQYPTLTAEETTEMNDILAPVNTYYDECIMKFIMGDMDVETEWDTFIETLKSYGDMERVCEILNSKEMPEYSGNWR